MIEIITDKVKWDDFIKSAQNSDFYHTYDYHQISCNAGEEPVLIKYTEGKKTIGLPLLLRKISGTIYSDATSVYGYSGPLTCNILKDFDNTTFRKELRNLLLENNIVSVFTRLNPFIPTQNTVLNKLGEIITMGNIVTIDLTKSLEIQRQKYNRRLKTYINKARRHCSIRKAENTAEIQQYIDIYYENMSRVQAEKGYFFKKEYFFDLFHSKSFKTEILLAIHNDTNTIIAGAMFIKTNNIVQYHLAGAKTGYLHVYPIKLLIDEMRIVATSENYDYLNLGGGLGSNEDSLFRFKSCFSKDFQDFKLWEFIVNDEVYSLLAQKKQEKDCHHTHYVEKCKEYFPCYRCSIKKPTL